MNYENFKFTTEENENGFVVTITGDKDKLRGRLEAFEAFINFKQKAKKAGVDFRDSESPMRQFFKSMHDRYDEEGEHPFKHRHSCKSRRGTGTVDQSEENNTDKE